jgi:hypothetical protein
MDHAPLRPLPGRPSAPVADSDAVGAVALAVPRLENAEREALALVALASRPRYEVGARLGLDAEALAVALTRARKELRRTLAPLPGSGWCERAERLISDRLDDALPAESSPRLDVHLRNCPRCVEHERRLVQASDALVASVEAPRAEPAAAEPVAAAADPVPLAPAPVEEPPPAAAADDSAAPQRSRRRVVAALSWNVLLALAILLAVASLALAVAGALGAQL